jgi:hypothetical protein
MSSSASRTSASASGAGPLRHFRHTRIGVHDSRHSFNPMQYFEMKSESVSAAGASSSIVANDKLQFSNCGTINRATPPAPDNRSQKSTTRHAYSNERSRMS